MNGITSPPPRSVGDPPLAIVDRLRRAALIVLALGVVAFLIVGANRPANPRLVTPRGRVSVAGLTNFGATSLSVTAGPGLRAPSHPLCALLASTPAQKAQGLMGQTSLRGFSGMVFSFSPPVDAVFYMKATVLPLSIAWFDSTGAFVASTDMKPCPATVRLCPTYRAGRPFADAIEVGRGRLGSFGIGPGSVMHLTGPCSG